MQVFLIAVFFIRPAKYTKYSKMLFIDILYFLKILNLSDWKKKLEYPKKPRGIGIPGVCRNICQSEINIWISVR